MNRWYQIRRLRGAVILILIGVLALLNQWNILLSRGLKQGKKFAARTYRFAD